MKCVLITGGSRGIGAACVRRFCAEGCKVSFIYNKSDEEAKRLAAETGAVPLCADVGDSKALAEAIAEAAKQMGTVDVLVNNAGLSLIDLFSNTDDEKLSRLLAVNLTSAMIASREASSYMISAKKGYIVNVGSVWGKVGASCEVAYSATKAGLRGFTFALAKELGPSGVTVNCVEPGVIDTDMNKELDEETMEWLVGETPLGRLGTPDEVAEMIFWLCSGKADFVTGQAIGIDGGFGQ